MTEGTAMTEQHDGQSPYLSGPNQPTIEEIKLGPDVPDDVKKVAIAREFGYAWGGLLIGLVVVIIGAVLVFGEKSGLVDLSFKGLGIDSHLQTAVVGVVVLVVGVLIIVLTRPKATVRWAQCGSGL
jgi:hypothetical protein